MKRTSLTIIFTFISFFVIVGLACGTSTPDPTATPQPEVQVEVVEEPTVEVPVVEEVVEEVVVVPTATDPPMREIPPTATPEPVVEEQEETDAESELVTGLDYFIEDFDVDPDWYFEVIADPYFDSDPFSVTYSFNNGRMIFNIPEKELYAYYIYDFFTYDTVRLDINYENRGVNSQQVSLVCNLSDEGWYEFAVQSDGLWYLYYAIGGEYDRIASGGSTYIKMGKEINQYTLICEGNKVSFYINGVQPTGSPHIDRRYSLRGGFVGFSVSSLQATPVKVEVDWFAITPP